MAGRMEVFPTLSTQVPRRTQYNYQDLRDLYGSVDIHPFILYLDRERVYIEKKEWSDKLVLNLNRLAKDAGGTRIEDRIRSWDLIARCLSGDRRSELYCDRRLSYVFDNYYFLVKSAFTFGLRTVPEGVIHLYQTTTRPLHFYLMPKGGRHRFRMGNRLLAVDEGRLYKHILLKPNTAYRVTAGTSYVFMASQKAFFSLHVLPESMQLPFRTVDPAQEFRAIQRERRREFVYERPPPTPNLLQPEEPVFQVPQRPFNYNIPPPTPNLLDQPEQEDAPPPYEALFPQDQPEPEPTLQQPEPELIFQQPDPQQPILQQPEPHQLVHQTTFAFLYSIERNVNVVYPQLVKWYQSLKRPLDKSELLEHLGLANAGGQQTEPLDLTSKGPLRKKKRISNQASSNSTIPDETSPKSNEEPVKKKKRTSSKESVGSDLKKRRTVDEETIDSVAEDLNEIDLLLSQERKNEMAVYEDLIKLPTL